MKSDYNLAGILGSPFAKYEETLQNASLTQQEKVALYSLARKNKVSLFFLERLKEAHQLDGFENLYNEEENRYRETLITAVKLCATIDEITQKYAIFKFLKPFPHIPSDVDALFFLSESEFQQSVQHLLHHGYFRIAESPSQVVIYDLRGGIDQMDTRSVDGKKGGKFYIDLYREVSASHIIYVSKDTLWDYRIREETEEGEISTLHPIADLCVVLAHTIVPERLLTVADYYMTLHHINNMNAKQIDELAQLIVQNEFAYAGGYAISVISRIHHSVHGFVPEKLISLSETLSSRRKVRLKVVPHNTDLPFRYPAEILAKMLLERMKDENGFRSFAKQVAFSMNPRLGAWVVSNWSMRGKRDTY